LSDMQNILNEGGNLQFSGQSGETPVTTQLHVYYAQILVLLTVFKLNVRTFSLHRVLLMDGT